VRLLHRLREHGPLGHRESAALPAEAFLRPHLRDDADVFVPRLLRFVGVGFEAGELGPGGRASGAEVEAPVGHDVEHGGALGCANRMVELRDADDDPVSHPDALGLHRARREEDLGGRTV
jgi:hypothetical protein